MQCRYEGQRPHSRVKVECRDGVKGTGYRRGPAGRAKPKEKK